MQTTGLPPVQTPATHPSVWLHALPSLQAAPSVLAVAAEHAPVVGLQVPAMWHWSAGHVTGLLPMHTPASHASVWLHALPSLHGNPSALAVATEHVPFVGSQLPAMWHGSAVQTTGLLPVQTPAMHVSVWLHALPSLHVTPSDFAAAVEQVPVVGLHVPATWH